MASSGPMLAQRCSSAFTTRLPRQGEAGGGVQETPFQARGDAVFRRGNAGGRHRVVDQRPRVRLRVAPGLSHQSRPRPLSGLAGTRAVSRREQRRVERRSRDRRLRRVVTLGQPKCATAWNKQCSRGTAALLARKQWHTEPCPDRESLSVRAAADTTTSSIQLASTHNETSRHGYSAQTST